MKRIAIFVLAIVLLLSSFALTSCDEEMSAIERISASVEEMGYVKQSEEKAKDAFYDVLVRQMQSGAGFSQETFEKMFGEDTPHLWEKEDGKRVVVLEFKERSKISLWKYGTRDADLTRLENEGQVFENCYIETNDIEVLNLIKSL